MEWKCAKKEYWLNYKNKIWSFKFGGWNLKIRVETIIGWENLNEEIVQSLGKKKKDGEFFKITSNL